MNIVDKLAFAVQNEPSSELEEACRRSLAIAMCHKRRVFAADEIEELVQDVVEEESVPDLSADSVEDGEIEVSDIERSNIPDDEIVTVDDDEGVVVEGRFARLRVVPDTSVRTISASIAKHVEMLVHMANVNEGIDMKAIYHPVPDVTMPCPLCASRNVTPVWYDGGEVTAHCNECDAEFDASIDEVAHATLAERTVEDIDILPEYDVFGSVWLEDDGYGYEVYAEGELVDSGSEDSYEDVLERFDDIADAYDEIGEGSEIDFDNGKSEVVEEVDGDDIEFEGGRKASRARIARMVADKRAFIDNSAKKASMKFEAGQMYESALGSIIVDSVMSDGVYATIIACGPDGSVNEKVARFTNAELRDTLLRRGYLL